MVKVSVTPPPPSIGQLPECIRPPHAPALPNPLYSVIGFAPSAGFDQHLTIDRGVVMDLGSNSYEWAPLNEVSLVQIGQVWYWSNNGQMRMPFL